MDDQLYKPPLFFKNGHVQTIYPTLFRKLYPDLYIRERISTPDDDFLDLDWSRVGSDSLAIISHGLEGNSDRAYIVGMVRAMNSTGIDALAWNYRTCSGETNKQLRLYHSGATDDLDTVISHVTTNRPYRNIILIGFSMGGNISLKYLGEMSDSVNPRISHAITFSVPCDLHDSSIELEKLKNMIYMKRFLRMLHQKVKEKMVKMPGLIDDDQYHLIKTFRDFDNRYTAPIHGFKDAEDYWKKSSSRYFIEKIRVPTLIVNAMNDPFLAGECYPYEASKHNSFVTLEVPGSGGHVGFIEFNRENRYWSEKRAVNFIIKNK